METVEKSVNLDYLNITGDLLPYFNRKIKLRITGDKLLILDFNEIVYFLAQGKYADIIHIDGTKERVFHSLGDLEKLTPAYLFVRAGRSYLINLKYVYKIDIRKRSCTLRINSGNLENVVINNLSERAVKKLSRNDNYQTILS